MEKSKENNQPDKSVSEETNPVLQNKESNISSDGKINKKYKDSLFIDLFSDKQSIIDLYNAIEGTSYTYDTEIEVITLEGVVYRNKINDLCFTIDNKFIILVEHQSTINENMPLRFLIYVAREYEKILDSKKVYSRKRIEIPTPEFIVLYNGKDKFPKRKTLQLSDAFKVQQDNPTLNLMVEVINIKYDENIEFVNKCKMLKDYSYFICLINDYIKKGLKREEALKKAAEQCIKENILADYLKNNMSEVFNMLMTEWDFEQELEVSREEAKEEGIREGIQKGIQKGIQNLITTCQKLGISYDITLQKVIEKYSLEETQAKDLMNNYWK